MCCGLKCLKTSEYVGEPVAAVALDQEGSGGAIGNVPVCRVQPQVSLEGAWSIATSDLSPLSRLQLVDFKSSRVTWTLSTLQLVVDGGCS